MKLRLYHVDAFARGPFSGNPAAVVVLADFPSDEWLLAVPYLEGEIDGPS